MNLGDPAAYALLCAALLLLSLERLARWRDALFTAVSLAFVLLALQFSALSVALLAVSLALHYGSLCLMRLWPAHRVKVFRSWLLLALAGFLVAKQYDWATLWLWQPPPRFETLVTVGLSFVFFRQICLSIEALDAGSEPVRLRDYVNYNLAYWTFVAGPLQRFDDFREQQAKLRSAEPVPARETLRGLNRAAFGFIKVFILGGSVNAWATTNTFLDDPSPSRFVVFLLAFPVYLYLNFSGYCDVVIGLARAVGFGLPENFDHPYFARNPSDFWTRWHITLSELFRDYVYFPMQTALARRGPLLVAMSAATVASFLLMGIWHGNTPGYAIFGLMHGVGVVATNLYGIGLKKFLGKERYKRYQRNRLVHVLAVVLCQCYVVLAFLPFRYGAGELAAVARTLGIVGGPGP